MTQRVIGGLLIGVGVILALRPLTTLALLIGIIALGFVGGGLILMGRVMMRWGRLLDRRFRGTHRNERVRKIAWKITQSPRPYQMVAGLVLTLAGVGAVVWVEKTYLVLAYLPSITLLVYGLVTLGRNAASLHPITGFGRPLIWGPSALLVAFAIWPFPDVVLMTLALGSAVAVACVGIATVRGGPWRVRPRTRRIGVVGALPAAVVLVIASGAASTHPSPDDFYVPDTELGQDTKPGSLISQDAVPAPRGAVAKRIVYSTSHHGSDSPVLASGVVYVPRGATNPPVIAWAHGTTGQTRGCAPSVIGQEAGGMMVLDDLLQAGWAVMATDYAGLATSQNHPYLIGTDQAKNVIDGVKAAQTTGLGVGEQTVLWGYSQGGHAALWAAQIWADYAPEHTLAGVVAFAPAADLVPIATHWAESKLANPLSAYLLAAYAQEYPDVSPGDYLRPGAAQTANAYTKRCLNDPGTAVSLTASLLQEGSMWKTPDIRGPLKQRLEQNVPTGSIDVPVLITQGLGDRTIDADTQQDYVNNRCQDGWELDYRTYSELGHNSVVEAGSDSVDDAILWTAVAFSGDEMPGAC